MGKKKDNQQDNQTERLETPRETMLQALLGFDFIPLENDGVDTEQFKKTAMELFEKGMVEIIDNVQHGIQISTEVYKHDNCQVVISHDEDTIATIIIQYVPVSFSRDSQFVPIHKIFEGQ